ncbi:sensor histidine kinase [Sphingobacterium suaedae]|uniref:histidine kinase n=1 Tax=Sphingobacterium suaedae TaxID=1686402 RepID=A0ABW5KDJ7_9SPHI
MKLKHRLSLYSVAIFTVVILAFSVLIYFAYYAQMGEKENQSLESKSLLAAIYYLEQDELSLSEHTHVQNQLYKTISRRNIAVFDSLDRLHSGDMRSTEAITPAFLQQVRMAKIAFFATDDFFYNGIFYQDNQGDFVVITREPKGEFNAQMKSLFHILLAVFLVGLLFIFFFSQYLSYIAYQPIVRIIAQIRERDSRNFNEPLSLFKTYTEVEDLVKTYNHFVTRIAETFNVQKNFIDYVSHELRTPIAALLGTLEVTKSKPRTAEEYTHVIGQLQQYTTDLQETLDHMMLLSGAKTNFEFSSIRIDEVVWQVIENKILYHRAHIDVDIQVVDNALLCIQGNEKLLELAIGNIVENAIKYSDNQLVRIVFRQDVDHLVISVQDRGIGIPEKDLSNITQNFYRGQNTQHYQGKGVGLSMAQVIFTLHGIGLTLSSCTSGTTVLLHF